MATIKDVARAAGLSPAAVSRHLNGRISLPAETRARIDKAIKELDYRPNLMAKRLSTGRTEALSLVTPHIDNPFFTEFAATVEAAAAQAGYSVYFSSTHGDPDREIAAIRRLRDRHVDGMIFLPRQVDDGALLDALDGLDNIVIVDEDIDGATQPRIFVENEAGTRLAVKHLVELGHKDIAMVGGGPEGVLSAVERERGWRSALAEHGLAPSAYYGGDYSREHGRATAAKLMEGELPTALVVGADEIAIGLIEILRPAGVRIPEDISIVGFDDARYSALIAPALTTVRQPVQELGYLAFNHLLKAMAGETVAHETRVPVELIVRESSAPPRA
ncbi:LacI family DNA-binding transcriptional regulator [Celeribacter sp.]|uniref:LacI family DNA-binding transcriptional regulator n=1 Tax=Celeribacter sp. TaxID=1890673 RepID=UPI003A90067C